jgi:hypothetical protein
MGGEMFLELAPAPSAKQAKEISIGKNAQHAIPGAKLSGQPFPQTPAACKPSSP